MRDTEPGSDNKNGKGGGIERNWQQSDWGMGNRQRKESSMAGVVSAEATGDLKVP